MRMGGKRYTEFLARAGIGSRTGVGLPGEEAGTVKRADSLRIRDVANMGFGQTVSVTPLQLLAAISGILNDGQYMAPQIVRRVLNADGTVYREVPPRAGARICSVQTARIVRQMLVGVVQNGTGRGVRIPGAVVGGKTGTAQIWDPTTKSFSSSQYVMSFVLCAPANRIPDFVILVVAKNPKIGEHGSDVAGPACKSVAQYLLQRSAAAAARPQGAPHA
jgi:cell division protein FtsI/penicillin-binding protein 2